MKYRKRGKNNCYQVYSHRYLKLLESLSTEDKPVDFYIEDWLFDIDYKIIENTSIKLNVLEPMQSLYLKGCFWKRTDRDKYNCLYPNIRWQSGDIRKIFFGELHRAVENLVEGFVQHQTFYIDDFKKVIKEHLPFLELFTKNYKFFKINQFIETNYVLKKELNKQENKKFMIDAIQKYTNTFFVNRKSKYVDKFVAYSKNDYFPINNYTKGSTPQEIKDSACITNIRKIDQNKMRTIKFIDDYLFFEDILYFFRELVIPSSFLMDIYTILRMFKKTDLSVNHVKPYYVYCYFGSYHIKNMVYFFTQILDWYDIIINKQETGDNISADNISGGNPVSGCLEKEISPDKNCRCIYFEEGEYLENSKEIRQLSGPVSFYRLQAKNKNTRPYYITLFGDRHNSVRGQCKECNVDYIDHNIKNL